MILSPRINRVVHILGRISYIFDLCLFGWECVPLGVDSMFLDSFIE